MPLSETSLVGARIVSGIWEAVLLQKGRSEGSPRIEVTHLGAPVAGLEVAPRAPGKWDLRLPIPPALIADGVQTFVVREAGGEVLASFAIVVGEPLAQDLRAEIDLLRAELDLLKRAFRRHCAETA